MNLWFAGRDSKGTRGIIPIVPFRTVSEPAALSFWLVKNDERMKFECWVMNKIARVTHMSMFVHLYCGGSGAGQIVEEEDSAGAGVELKISFDREVKAPPSPGALPPVEAPGPPVAPVNGNGSAKNKPKKKRSKSDMFDPFDGLIY